MFIKACYIFFKFVSLTTLIHIQLLIYVKPLKQRCITWNHLHLFLQTFVLFTILLSTFQHRGFHLFMIRCDNFHQRCKIFVEETLSHFCEAWFSILLVVYANKCHGSQLSVMILSFFLKCVLAFENLLKVCRLVAIWIDNLLYTKN